MSKPGDTLDDYIEDGITPTPRKSTIQDKINKSQEIQEFITIMKSTAANQR